MALGSMFVIVSPSARRPPSGPTLLRSSPPIPGEDRWEAGMKWVPEACGAQDLAVVPGYCGATFGGWNSAAEFPLGTQVDYMPLFVAVAAKCSTIGGAQVVVDTEERATRLLGLAQGAGIARELWRGDHTRAESPDLPNNFLANEASFTDLGAGGDFNVLDSLAALEKGLADCSSAGGNMIHASAQLATYWAHLRVVERAPDGRLFTALGTAVVVDPGYDGAGPGGAAPAADGSYSWAYGTGPVDVRLGEVTTMVDTAAVRTQNDLVVYAYRPFAATFDPCCHLAAKVDHTTLT
jgi:hypothetical protein